MATPTNLLLRKRAPSQTPSATPLTDRERAAAEESPDLPIEELSQQETAPRILLLAPPERIEAEPAPRSLYRPLSTPKDFTEEVIDEGLRSDNPGVRRLALRDSGVPEQVQDLVNAGVERPPLPDHSHDKKRSFLGNVGHVLEHAGKAALAGLSTGNPLLTVPAAIAGSINAKYADEVYDRNILQPRWEHDDAVARARANDTLNRAREYATVSSIDPLTGKPTLNADHKDRAYRLSVEKFLEQQEKNNQTFAMMGKRLDLAETSANLARRRQLVAEYNAGLHNDNLQAVADELGITGDLRPKFFAGEIQLQTDGQGNLVAINKRTKTAAPVTSATGQPVTSYQKTKAETEQQQFNRRQSETERHHRKSESIQKNKPLGQKATGAPTKQQIFSAIRIVQTAINQAKELRRRGSKQATAALEAARVMARQAGEIYGEHIEVGGFEEDEFPYIKSRAGVGSHSGQTPPQSQQMNADEAEYQRLYPKLSPEQRKVLEDAFEKDHKRRPNPPKR